MTRRARAVVVGGGAVGCSVLWHLARKGWTDTVLCERSELTSGSTWHAAGHVIEYTTNPTISRLNHYGAQLYSELESLTGQAREHLELTNSPARQLAASAVLLQSTACLSLLLYWTCPCPPRCRAGTAEYLTPTLIRSAGSPSA